MTSVQLPSFRPTPVEEIPSIVSRLRKTFFSQKTRPAEFRIKQLRRLYWAIADHEKELLEACKRDLGKGYFEAFTSEIDWVQNDIIYLTQNLEKWMKDEKPRDIAWTNRLVRPRIRKDPLGVVLVVGYDLNRLDIRCSTLRLTRLAAHSIFLSIYLSGL